MKLACILVMTLAVPAIPADETPVIAKQYLPFQGQWKLVAQEGYEFKDKKPPEVFMTITGRVVKLSGDGISTEIPAPLEILVPANKRENPYRELKTRGAEKLDDIVDVKNQISFFWSVGIYGFEGEQLQIALRYCGQGVEGIHFKNFRPPSSFEEKPTDGETRITFKRETVKRAKQ